LRRRRGDIIEGTTNVSQQTSGGISVEMPPLCFFVILL
jgi:hypothetical protein